MDTSPPPQITSNSRCTVDPLFLALRRLWCRHLMSQLAEGRKTTTSRIPGSPFLMGKPARTRPPAIRRLGANHARPAQAAANSGAGEPLSGGYFIQEVWGAPSWPALQTREAIRLDDTSSGRLGQYMSRDCGGGFLCGLTFLRVSN